MLPVYSLSNEIIAHTKNYNEYEIESSYKKKIIIILIINTKFIT